MATKKQWIIFVITIILILTTIYYFENSKIAPELTFQQTQTDLKENKYPKAPELNSIEGYINTKEIKISDFKGKVVLIDFWTYSCINCIRTLPHLTEWDRKYKDKGLVIIGVHTPEFKFERDINNVKAAVKEFNVEYPVVLDNKYGTWQAFKNNYWPRKYLIDKDGYIRYDHIGEGGYDETEKQIQELLSEITELENKELSNLEDKTPNVLPRTPELYAGYAFALPRGQDVGNDGGIQPTKTINYKLPEVLDQNYIYLDNSWENNDDNLRAKDKDSSIYLDFTAKSANIVAGSLSDEIQVEIFINGNPISKDQAGSDVLFDGEKAYIKVKDPKLYNLLNTDYGNYKLKLKINSDQFYFNAFTFG